MSIPPVGHPTVAYPVATTADNAHTPARADRDVVLAAVQQYGWALLYAAPSLRADRDVVLAAVQQHGWALQFADASLRGDRGRC